MEQGVSDGAGMRDGVLRVAAPQGECLSVILGRGNQQVPINVSVVSSQYGWQRSY